MSARGWGGGRVRTVANVIHRSQRQRSRSTRSLTSRHKTEATSATKLTIKVTAQPAKICRMGLRQTCAKTTSRSAIRSSRHLEGANITAVSSEAAPDHMDTDSMIEVLIPAFCSLLAGLPTKLLRHTRRQTGGGRCGHGSFPSQNGLRCACRPRCYRSAHRTRAGPGISGRGAQ